MRRLREERPPATETKPAVLLHGRAAVRTTQLYNKLPEGISSGSLLQSFESGATQYTDPGSSTTGGLLHVPSESPFECLGRVQADQSVPMTSLPIE